MESASAVYINSPTAQLVAPWIAEHLPDLDPVVQHRLTQLTTGLMEMTDVRIEQIAQGSAFQAKTTSNETQVRRIMRDPRLSLDAVYFPLITSLLATIPNDTIYICMDESSHTNVLNLFQVTVVTDAMALPLSFFLYEPGDAWADDARSCLEALASCIPDEMKVIILADRVHAGYAFITCIEALGWSYVIRLAKNTYIETEAGWKRVQSLHPRRYPTRRWEKVSIWKQNTVQANIVIHRHEPAGFKPVIWYVITNLPPTQMCCVLYAVRWWQECGFKITKSAVFDWEQSRMRHMARVEVLLIGVACATWMLWMLGRDHEQQPRLKPTTQKPQPRRVRIIRIGIKVCRDLCTGRRTLASITLPPLRVLDYERMFAPPE